MTQFKYRLTNIRKDIANGPRGHAERIKGLGRTGMGVTGRVLFWKEQEKKGLEREWIRD